MCLKDIPVANRERKFLLFCYASYCLRPIDSYNTIPQIYDVAKLPNQAII